MPELRELSRVREQAEKCVRCGLCLYTCPVYAEEQNENYVARGRNHLLRETIDNPDDLVAGVEDRFSKCLLCRRCTMVCPQGVRTDLLTVAARAECVKSGRLPFSKSILFRKLLKDRDRMKKAVRAASRFQWLLPASGEHEGRIPLPVRSEGKIRHIPLFLAGLGRGRQLPSIAGTFLSEQVQEINPPPLTVARRSVRVAFFSGCSTEYCFPEEGKALIRILNQQGVEVVFPKKQGCCGLPVLASGDLDTAREIALHNLGIFLELNVDFVVTGCASCGSTLKEGWAAHLSRTEEERIRFEGFGKYVRDISELLVELADFRSLRFRSRLPESTRVTYHDPCHLARYQGVVEQPRKILRQVFGRNFVEMDDRGCCGMGGSFSVEHYRLSKKIAQKKIESIVATDADVVVTACPGCKVQLIDNLKRCGLPQRVFDIVETVEPVPVLEDSVTFESLRTRIGI